MSSRLPLLLAAVVLACAGIWWTTRGEDSPAPPAPHSSQTPVTAAPAPANPADVRAALAPPPAAGTTVTDPPRPAPVPMPAPPDAANVLLRVRDLTTRLDVPAFRWQFQTSLGVQRGEASAGRAELRLPETASGTLLVEAPNLAPLQRPLVVPDSASPPLQLDLFLGPAVPAAGITLHVRTLAGEAVPTIRVDAWELQPTTDRERWHLGQPLWSRRTGGLDGRYVLPTLPAGEYGIRVVATDLAGESLPLLPWRSTFQLTGDNGFVEDVPLEAGALLVLDLVDAAGQVFDPSQHGSTTLSLRLPGGPELSRKWVVRSGGAAAAAIDAVAGVGRVELADALPAGQYELTVKVGGAVRALEGLFLRAGMQNVQRVVVR